MEAARETPRSNVSLLMTASRFSSVTPLTNHIGGPPGAANVGIIHEDSSFPDLSSLAEEESLAYSYFGCFNLRPADPFQEPLSFAPSTENTPTSGIVGAFTTQAECFAFCSEREFAYASFLSTYNT